MAKVDSGEIARRYAKALFELALDRNLIVEMLQQSGALVSAVNRETLLVFCSPLYEDYEKEALLDHLVSLVGVDDLLARTLRVLLANRRFHLLKQVVSAYRDMVDSHMGVLRATLVSAKPLDPAGLAEFEETLAARLGKKVFLAPVVDERMLAGYQVRLGNTLIDASLETRLRRLCDSVGQGV